MNLSDPLHSMGNHRPTLLRKAGAVQPHVPELRLQSLQRTIPHHGQAGNAGHEASDEHPKGRELRRERLQLVPSAPEKR